MNVNQNRKQPCTGCGACSAVCPKRAIIIKPNDEGFFAPLVDNELCVNCGRCTLVCYSHLEKMEQTDPIRSYYGWHKDPNILKGSASGGVTQALTFSCMKQGYFVAGCTYDAEQKKAKHIIIREIGQLNRISGSKYFQSDMTEFYSALSELDRNVKIIIFGTPCQLLGVRKAMETLCFKMEQVILVEIFCHGVPSPEVWRAYLRSRPRADRIKDIRFRTKTYGWHYSSNEFVDIYNHIIPTKRVGDDFFRAYYSKQLFSKACYDCKARQALGNADLRIGDFWGKRFLNDRKGVSCILAFSTKGIHAIESCEEVFELHDADTQEILASQSYKQVYPFDAEIWEKAYKTIREQEDFSKTIKVIRSKIPLNVRMKEDVYIFLSNFQYRLLHNEIAHRR